MRVLGLPRRNPPSAELMAEARAICQWFGFWHRDVTVRLVNEKAVITDDDTHLTLNWGDFDGGRRPRISVAAAYPRADVLQALIHELVHLQQWYTKGSLTERGVEQATERLWKEWRER